MDEKSDIMLKTLPFKGRPAVLKYLSTLNPHLTIMALTDQRFRSYGRMMTHEPFEQVIKHLLDAVPMPAEGNRYVPHDSKLAACLDMALIQHQCFGDLKIQIGYVNGYNSRLNALEYHKSSEIVVAATGMVLLLGKTEDIIDDMYDSNKLIAVYVEPGQVLELFGSTLHFSPCKIEPAGFKAAIILPWGTNTETSKASVYLHQEDRWLFKKNKWLLAHPENRQAIESGAIIGIKGPNIEINY
ncbi:MAG: DUF4867 family protein [Acholeplasmataceae bacterium]|nr:MAG: DUF4867 family protein [Acholeplasmataceae bacterium]